MAFLFDNRPLFLLQTTHYKLGTDLWYSKPVCLSENSYLKIMSVSFYYVALIYFFRILSWLIVARVLVSWFAPGSRHPVVLFIKQTSEAVIAPVRNVLPKGSGSMAMVDWSPLVTLILLDILRYGLIKFFVF